MKKGIQYLAGAVFTSVLVLVLFFLSVIVFPKDVFSSSYQAAIQRKFDYLMSIEEPKIIIIGGSSAGFGINEEYIEKATGYPVANLGLHAGFGALFPMELSKANINPGDIIILAPEWGWNNDRYERVGADLIMSGIDSRLDIYRYVCTPQFLSAFIGYLPTYAEKKSIFTPVGGAIYSISSFDENGRMIVPRPNMTFDYENNVDVYGEVWMESIEMDDTTVSYLTSYREFIESKGAHVYFAACPTYKAAVRSSDENFRKIAALEEEKTGIPYISDPSDYFFPDEYMFDTIYHCNNAGELHRSELLVQDLLNAGAFSVVSE